ncbi:hypothetical protein F2Q68_00015049 [Brassica cretica]|uniref:Uncharacterized protein n=2 Tax=Brassica cretica TaxID=69181 RepID=A0A8S9HJF7_BRACR|nr:hypothetical protein F2Q68_00015049 [Brassica cretica]KAF3611472.1 hypothetical protein DY000_02047787 [Brassica cretica]
MALLSRSVVFYGKDNSILLHDHNPPRPLTPPFLHDLRCRSFFTTFAAAVSSTATTIPVSSSSTATILADSPFIPRHHPHCFFLAVAVSSTTAQP